MRRSVMIVIKSGSKLTHHYQSALENAECGKALDVAGERGNIDVTQALSNMLQIF